MCLTAAFVPHRPNKYFHVIASNGIVSSSPYTPLAIMTASPIASVRVFETVRDADLATFGALPTSSMIDRAIIMLNDHRFWGHASGPSSSSGKTLSSFHPLLARPCRSALPRERFSPLGTFETCRRHPRMSVDRGRPEVIGRLPNRCFGPKHKVAALQPAAREQEPRGRHPVERTAMAGWQGQHDQVMYCRRATHDQEQQGSSGRPAP